MKSKRQISCSLCAAKAINLRMCVTEKEAKKKRQRGRRTAGVFRRGSNHSPQLLSTLLPPPLQLCSALASRRVRSNLSLAFCCCCCCGYTGCLSLSPFFSLFFSLSLCSCSFNLPASLVFLGFVFFAHFAAWQIMRVAHFCVAYFRALAHTHTRSRT